MNATGESDLQNYYDMIEEKQESVMRPILDKVMPVHAMSSWDTSVIDMDYKSIRYRERHKRNWPILCSRGQQRSWMPTTRD